MLKRAACCALLVTAGCALSDKPIIRACAPAGRMHLGVSGDSLRIIPSSLPGVEVTHASWRVYGRSGLIFPASQGLELRTVVRSAHDSLDRRIALLYEFREGNKPPTLVIDDRLEVDGHVAVVSEGVRSHNVPEEFKTLKWIDLGTGIVMGPTVTGQQPCPVAVRAVPMQDVPLYSLSGISASANREELTGKLQTPVATTDTGVISVQSVTRSKPDPRSAFRIVLQNKTDTTLTELVFALVVGANVDTIEFLAPKTPPHGIISLYGGNGGLAFPVTPVWYARRRIKGRFIATTERDNLVSRMGLVKNVNVTPTHASAEINRVVSVIARLTQPNGFDHPDFLNLPRRWTVTPSDAHVRLTDTTYGNAILTADRPGRVKVTFTVGGVSGSTEVVFKSP